MEELKDEEIFDVAMEEFPLADEEHIEDREARELAASSLVLMDIYGKKIKLDISWYFESPVVMKEDRIGSIANVPTAIPLDDYYQEDYGSEMYYPGGPFGGGGNPMPPPFFGGGMIPQPKPVV